MNGELKSNLIGIIKSGGHSLIGINRSWPTCMVLFAVVSQPETDTDKGDQIGVVNKSVNPQLSISVIGN